MKIALYIRVSTVDQNPDMQLQDLRKYCEFRGFHEVEEFIDHGVSGKKSKRPALDKMMNGVRKGHIKTVVVWSLSRLGRNLRHMVELAEEFNHYGITLISLKQNIDTATAQGRFFFNITSALDEYNREMIAETVKAGLQAAKARGVVLGRRRREVSPNELRQLHELREQGLSFTIIAERTGICRSVVYRALKGFNFAKGVSKTS